jgi:hypothetical protein
MASEYRESTSGRASSETTRAAESSSSPSVDEFEKASLMRGDVPDSPRNKPFWRRHLLSAAINFFIFTVYITVGILALDSRAKSAVGGRSLLWCKCRIKFYAVYAGLIVMRM